MLYSPSARIAFAHYPKTAGTSLAAWFYEAFPDASLIDPTRGAHLTVRASLARLQNPHRQPPRSRITREIARLWDTGLKTLQISSRPCDVRIFGVIRDPFEMLVSMYEYWRRLGITDEPSTPLARIALTGNFHRFVSVAVMDRHVHTYEKFFDVGGPAWRTTRLIAFNSLQDGLDEVCREFGILHRPHLDRLNTTTRYQRSLDDYADEAGPLRDRITRYFAWYYSHGIHLALRGPGSESDHLQRAA